MTSAEIIQRIMEVWAGHTALVSFCQTLYGRRPKIRNFVDMNNPVADEDFPLISFYGSRSGGGMAGPVIRHEFLVGFALVDDRVSVDAAMGIESCRGTGSVQTFRHLAQQALLSARIGRITWEGEEDPLTDFPVFTGYVTITVETPNSKTRTD